jgi:hypothetical protein
VQLGRGAECHRLQVTPASRRIRSLARAFTSAVALTRSSSRFALVLHVRAFVGSVLALAGGSRATAWPSPSAARWPSDCCAVPFCVILAQRLVHVSACLPLLHQRHTLAFARSHDVAACTRERLECMHRALRVGRCGSGLNFLLSAPLASATSQVFALWCARRFLLVARAHRQWCAANGAARLQTTVPIGRRFGVMMCGLSYLACFFLNFLDMRETVRRRPSPRDPPVKRSSAMPRLGSCSREGEAP